MKKKYNTPAMQTVSMRPQAIICGSDPLYNGGGSGNADTPELFSDEFTDFLFDS